VRHRRQFSFIVAIATLTIAARLKRFDRALEDAALNLGATRAAVLWTVTLPYLKPALIGAAAIAFLTSFENFNTTLMRVGSDPPRSRSRCTGGCGKGRARSSTR